MAIKLGAWGEQVAAKELERNGYLILQRNYRCKLGEIDLIALKQHTLVFIEVKTRRSMTYGLPCQSITPLKKKHIYRVAAFYLSSCHIGYRDIRIDVIEILKVENKWFLRHIENAF